MAGHVMKRRRLVNPGRRRRMTAKQIQFFGTRRQKAALRTRGRNPKYKGAYRGVKKSGTLSRKVRRSGGSAAKAQHYIGRHYARKRSRAMGSGMRVTNRRRNQFGGGTGLISRAEHAAERAISSVEHAAEQALEGVTRRLNPGRRNVGEILTVIPANPGRRRKSMTRTHNRRRNRRRNWRNPRARVSNRRHRRNYTHRRHNRRHNPRVVVRYRNRRHHRRHNRRRNPGMLSGNMGAIVGVLGGAAITKVITGFLPATFMQGWTGYITTGVTAVVVGRGTGAMLKNRQLGNWMMIGGLLIVALEVMSQFFPTLQLPFGLSPGTAGMGLISSSNFYVPQVNLPGSMASFVTPAGVTGAIPVVPATTSTAMHGLGQQFSPGFRTMRRIGRMR